MKAAAWRDFLEEQHRRYGKSLYTLTELAGAAGTTRGRLNVELHRLRKQGVITRYAQGRYGLPGAVTPQALLASVDSHAYITGLYALHFHNLVAQVPTLITCFTDRRSPRARERKTPVGRFVFVCIGSSVYAPPSAGNLAPPEQALCDYVYLLRRDGVPVEGQATFRNLDRLGSEAIERTLARYPSTVNRDVRRVVAGEAP